jgi:hypothetical protein
MTAVMLVALTADKLVESMVVKSVDKMVVMTVVMTVDLMADKLVESMAVLRVV